MAVTYQGQHCVIVAITSSTRMTIHTRNGVKEVYLNDLRETTLGEIQRQKRAAREGMADNSELWAVSTQTHK